MKSSYFILIAATICAILSSCGNNNNGKIRDLAAGAKGNMNQYVNSNVNAIQQSSPTIMVIPSDRVLKSFGCLKENNINGRTYIERDYVSYLVKDNHARSLISSIQSIFLKSNYPLTDFEQSLKQLENESAYDTAEGISKDAKTELLTTAQPDILLEMDYNNASSGVNTLLSHDYGNNKVSFTLNALDAYTNKVVATVIKDQLEMTSTTETVQKEMAAAMSEFLNDIQSYFSDILTKGREITVRINVAENSNVNLSDESIEGDTYSDWIVDYIKTHTIKGAYKMQRNTGKELYFVNVRIPLLQEDGTQYCVYDWTRDLSRNLRKNLGLQSSNKSQGLGEVVLTINGI